MTHRLFRSPTRPHWLPVGVATLCTLTSSLALAAPPHEPATPPATVPCPAADAPLQPQGAPADQPNTDLATRNQELSDQAKEGERWLLGGRLSAGAGLLFTAVGATMLAVYGVKKKKFDDSVAQFQVDVTMPLEAPVGPIAPPPSRALAGGGAVLLVAGVAGIGGGIWAMLRGRKKMQSARDGQLSLDVGRHHAGVALRGRF